jgi:glycosyltransferase 2 family protein
VHTPRVVTASITPEKDVAIVLTRLGHTLAENPTAWNEPTLAAAWQSIELLHSSGIVHGQVDDEHLILDGEAVGVSDLSGATLTPRAEQLRADEAQLLVASALALEADAAISAALNALGADGLALVLPFLQDTALTTHQRRQVKATKFDLDKFRKQAAERADVVAPDLQKMRRVTLGSVLQTALLVFAFFALAAGIGGLDLNELKEQLQNATWWLVVAGLILAQTPRVSGAVSVLGASPIPLALGPVYALQLATSYIALAIPSSAARIAVNIRFFQRHGLRSGTAMAVSALDSGAQYVVQFLLLIGILTLTPLTLDLNTDGSEPSKLLWLLLIVAVVAVIAVAVLFIVPKWRHFIVGWIVKLSKEALEAGRGLRSPRRLSMLFGGNLATEILFAFALQTMVRAFGYQVGMAELLLINVSVSLLSSFLPIPGGIGVVEGGLTVGLVKAGVPEEAAFAAVILYRLGTFYLPPIWGFFALRWLERNKHL